MMVFTAYNMVDLVWDSSIFLNILWGVECRLCLDSIGMRCPALSNCIVTYVREKVGVILWFYHSCFVSQVVAGLFSSSYRLFIPLRCVFLTHRGVMMLLSAILDSFFCFSQVAPDKCLLNVNVDVFYVLNLYFTWKQKLAHLVRSNHLASHLMSDTCNLGDLCRNPNDKM